MISAKVNSLVLITFLLIKCSKQVSVIVKNTHYIGSMKVIDDSQVNIFLGIPYAQPPVGSLRFKKPLPVEERKTVGATEWKPSCYQNELFREALVSNKVSEDCLYLNIWSPKNGSERNYEVDPLKPVLFYIHGGAFISESASRQIYDSEILAAKGDVVVVTFNYRLDVFGFLYTGTEDAPGNIGLWDQALALEWVVDNIAYFGGDPEQITIIGQNAGAFSVGVHLLSPITKRLYKNAIMISGSVFNHLIGVNPEKAKNGWLRGAKSVGCGDGKQWNQEIIACLRRVDANQLIKVSQSAIVGKEDDIQPQVIYGDLFLPEEPIKMLETGDHKKKVNILFGTTDDEGSLMLPMIDMIKYSLTNPKDITKEEGFEELKSFTKKLVSKTPIDGEKVSQVYISSLPSEDHSRIRRAIGVALGDYYITCPALRFAKLLFKNDMQNINVYQYLWGRKIEDSLSPCASWMGACPGSDISLLFGMPFVKNHLYTDEARNYSINIIKTISHFAYNGQPLSQDNKKWPKYNLKDDQLIAPYYKFVNNGIYKRRIYEQNLKNIECEQLWNKYID